jgi:hypothetical protein
MKKYILIDYYTDKQVSSMEYQTREDAENAIRAYLTFKALRKEIHNNLIIIKEI